MNITKLPSSEGPLDIIVKYSNNYSACFRSCQLLRVVVDRIFAVILKNDFGLVCQNPFLTYQRKKFALYSKIPEHGLSILEDTICFLSFSEKYYAYANWNTYVRDKTTNTIVSKPFATPRNYFGFITPNILKIDLSVFAIEGDTKDLIVITESSPHNIKKNIQSFIPYSLETLHVQIGRDIVAINKDGFLHFFVRDTQKFVQTSACYPDKVFYKNERLFLFSEDKLIDYDFINDRINYSVPVTTFLSVMDVDNDYVLVNLNIQGPTILHLPTQKILHSFQVSEWSLSGFDCMIYKGLNDSHTQRRYYLKKGANELSHLSA